MFCLILECNPGNYGYNCNQSCDECLSDACESKYGYCIVQDGCKSRRQYGQPGQYKCDIGIITISQLVVMHNNDNVYQDKTITGHNCYFFSPL